MAPLDIEASQCHPIGMSKISSAWLESLARSKAQIEAGQTVPLEPVLERLRASIARMDARRDEQTKQQARKV
jgi:hypothetical protein